ncbi:MAG: dienelactone hydrolase family protein [Oscillospiraceae bacterium]|nr:dienelactone hydrolase family protein [Oscillospiraceae bacterium]
MNIKSMQQAATELYDWAKRQYPEHRIIIMGHSYGTGMAAYLASARECDALVLAGAYRDLSDLYNKMTPVFWGPLKVFISNNIETSKYAETVTCPVYVIGSESDTTLSASLQRKVAKCFSNAELKIFENVRHENYFVTDEVIEYIKTNTG